MEIDGLFQLPLAEFTAARNALAAKFKKAGRADQAAEVKSLGRPSIAAWAVNQLYRSHRKAFDQLLAAGERLRKAQASQLRGKGGNMREPLDARREALANLTGRAEALLEAAGHTPSPDIMRRVTSTLDALATYGDRPDAPRAGRLTDEVPSPGFETLAALVPQSGGGREASAPTRVIPFRQRAEPKRGKKLDAAGEKRQQAAERKARLTAAVAAVREAERSLSDARRGVARAEAALKTAAAQAKQADQKKEALSALMEKATEAAAAARQEARRIAADAEEAAQAVEDAERALEAARRDKKSLAD